MTAVRGRIGNVKCRWNGAVRKKNTVRKSSVAINKAVRYLPRTDGPTQSYGAEWQIDRRRFTALCWPSLPLTGVEQQAFATPQVL